MVTMATSSSFFLFLLLLSCFVISHSSSASPALVAKLHSFVETLHQELAPSTVQESAAKGVLRRLIPSHVSSFDLRIVSKDDCGGKSCFQIKNHPLAGKAGNPEISITGTTGVEVCAGLHWYLKYWCGAHVSWEKT
eukprot:c1018_g1_i1 orf=221-628(+)